MNRTGAMIAGLVGVVFFATTSANAAFHILEGDMRKAAGDAGTLTIQYVVSSVDDPRVDAERKEAEKAGLLPQYTWSIVGSTAPTPPTGKVGVLTPPTDISLVTGDKNQSTAILTAAGDTTGDYTFDVQLKIVFPIKDSLPKAEIRNFKACFVVGPIGNDVQVIAFKCGRHDQECVFRGDNASWETSQKGDDILTAGVAFVTTGPNGICETKANNLVGTVGGPTTGDDIQMVQVGCGEEIDSTTGKAFICVDSSDGIRDTVTIGGDDKVVGNDVAVGFDGICRTQANK